MKEEINRIILEEITKMSLDKENLDALSEILYFERENIEQRTPRFKDKFTTIIERIGM